MLERSPSPKILYYIHFILILTYNYIVYTGGKNLRKLGKIMKPPRTLPKNCITFLERASAGRPCPHSWPRLRPFLGVCRPRSRGKSRPTEACLIAGLISLVKATVESELFKFLVSIDMAATNSTDSAFNPTNGVRWIIEKTSHTNVSFNQILDNGKVS